MTTLSPSRCNRSGHVTYPADRLLAYLDERPGRLDYCEPQRRLTRLPQTLQRRVRDIRKAGRVTLGTADAVLTNLGDVHLLGYMLGED